MDRRKAPRHAVNESVRVKSLDHSHAAMAGMISDISDDGMRLALPSCFPLGSTLELDCQDFVVLGAVVFCSKLTPNHPEGDWSIGVRIQHVAW